MRFERQAGTINIDLLDADVDDRLYVSVFFNYEIMNPTAPRSECTAPPSGEAKRSVTCDLAALCLEDDVPDRPAYTYHGMTVQVFDREPLDSGSPRFKAMEEGGLTTNWFFYLDCVEAET